MSLFRRNGRQDAVNKDDDRRLLAAERIVRDHALRLLRLEAEVGIYRPNPMKKERPA